MFSKTSSTSLVPCPTSTWNTTQYPSACPSDGRCCVEQYFKAPGCVFAGTTKCCSVGPPLPVSTTKKNCLVIGDSVSEQYTPSVAKLLDAECLVQHAPSVGGGSANNVASGLSNLQQCRWLRTALRPDVAVQWDLIAFNFGLHDLRNVADPTSLATYTSDLGEVADILKANAKEVLYILTTPFQSEALDGCGPYCSAGPTGSPTPAPFPLEESELTASPTTGYPPQPKNGGNGRCGPPRCVEGSLGCGVPNATAKATSPDPSAPGCGPPDFAVSKLNAQAVGVMKTKGIAVLDVNTVVHQKCESLGFGYNYSNCSLCGDETPYFGIRCGYHYASDGVALLANTIAAKMKEML